MDAYGTPQKKRHPRALLVMSKPQLRFQALLELTKVGFVVEEAENINAMTSKWRFPLFHNIVLIDSIVGDFNGLHCAQELRRLERHEQFQSAAKAHIMSKGRTEKGKGPFGETLKAGEDLSAPSIRAREQYVMTTKIRSNIVGLWTRETDYENMRASKLFDDWLRHPIAVHVHALVEAHVSHETIERLSCMPTFSEMLAIVSKQMAHRAGDGVAAGGFQPLSLNKGKQSAAAQQSTVLLLESKMNALEDKLADAQQTHEAAEEEIAEAHKRCNFLADALNDAERTIALKNAEIVFLQDRLAHQAHMLEDERKDMAAYVAKAESAEGRSTAWQEEVSAARHLVEANHALRDQLASLRVANDLLKKELQSTEEKLKRRAKEPVVEFKESSFCQSPAGSRRNSELGEMKPPTAPQNLLSRHNELRGSAKFKSTVNNVTTVIKTHKALFGETYVKTQEIARVVECENAKLENMLMEAHDEISKTSVHMNFLTETLAATARDEPLKPEWMLGATGRLSVRESARMKALLPTLSRGLLGTLPNGSGMGYKQWVELEQEIRALEVMANDYAATNVGDKLAEAAQRRITTQRMSVALLPSTLRDRLQFGGHQTAEIVVYKELIDKVFAPLKACHEQSISFYRQVLVDSMIEAMKLFTAEFKSVQTLDLAALHRAQEKQQELELKREQEVKAQHAATSRPSRSRRERDSVMVAEGSFASPLSDHASSSSLPPPPPVLPELTTAAQALNHISRNYHSIARKAIHALLSVNNTQNRRFFNHIERGAEEILRVIRERVQQKARERTQEIETQTDIVQKDAKTPRRPQKPK